MHPCRETPFELALEILDSSWTTLVLRDLVRKGALSFDELLHSSREGVEANTLQNCLNMLESYGVVERRLGVQQPPSVEFVLTPKGEALRPVVFALGRWGTDHNK